MPEQGNNRRHTRRRFLTTTGVAGTALLAGCVGGDDDDEGNNDETDNGDDQDNQGDTTGGDPAQVRFILNPAEADVNIVDQYQPIFTYLESELSVEVEPQRASSYSATFQSLRSGQGELADTSPSAAVAGGDILDVVGLRVAFGSDKYFSLITTTPDSGVEEVADIEGETVAMASTLSVSGTLAPLVKIKQAGIEIGEAPRSDPPEFTAQFSDHSTAREQLVNRDDVAVATTGAFSTAPHVPQEQFEELSQEFVDISAEYDGAGEAEPQLDLVSVSDPLPRAPIMSRSDWNDPIRPDVESALLNAPDSAFEQSEDNDADELWFTDIVEGSSEDYEPIQDILDELAVEFEDLS